MMWFWLIGLIVVLPFVVVLRRGAPYVRTLKAQRVAVLGMLGDVNGVKVADLGCGDSQLLVEALDRGAVVYGCELNPLLYLISRLRIGRRGAVQLRDMWSVNTAEFDVIFVFLQPQYMSRLEEKLVTDGFTGRLVSIAFEIPGRAADHQSAESVRLYNFIPYRDNTHG